MRAIPTASTPTPTTSESERGQQPTNATGGERQGDASALRLFTRSVIATTPPSPRSSATPITCPRRPARAGQAEAALQPRPEVDEQDLEGEADDAAHDEEPQCRSPYLRFVAHLHGDLGLDPFQHRHRHHPDRGQQSQSEERRVPRAARSATRRRGLRRAAPRPRHLQQSDVAAAAVPRHALGHVGLGADVEQRLGEPDEREADGGPDEHTQPGRHERADREHGRGRSSSSARLVARGPASRWPRARRNRPPSAPTPARRPGRC
jgi:hypothetical protein